MRVTSRSIRGTLCAALLMCLGPGAASAAVGAATPSVVDRLGSLAEAVALAISPAEDRAAASFMANGSGKRPQSRLVLATDPKAAAVEQLLPGRTRDLLFTVDGQTLLVLQHRSVKRTEGNAYLLRLPLDGTARRRPPLRLPPTAHAMVWLDQGRTLLIACHNELRTLGWPDLRSGPLYRVPGSNQALAVLSQTELLVGRTAEIVRLDLQDPPERHGLPARERLATSYPVVDLIPATADEPHPMARLADGTWHVVELEPLRLHPGASPNAARFVTLAPAPAERRAPRPKPTVPPSAPADAPPRDPARAGAVTPAEPPVAEASVGAAALADVGSTVVPTRTPAIAEAVPLPTEPDPVEAPPVAVHSPGTASVEGRVVGPASSQVAAVVLIGPDHGLREAARVTPDASGRFRTAGLAPGRYRLQLDGGRSGVIVAEPPFLLIDLRPDERHLSVEIVARRLL